MPAEPFDVGKALRGGGAPAEEVPSAHLVAAPMARREAPAEPGRAADLPPLPPPAAPAASVPAPAPPPPLPPSPVPPPATAASEADALRDDPESGILLAEHMAEAGYQPVILFGTAQSGKTSLILSLLALLKTDARLDAGLFLGHPILDTSKPYGAYLWKMASGFYGDQTQAFIDGTASPRTNITLPFFVPLLFRPSGRPEARIAFMESNGEWYQPNSVPNKFFPPLRRQIEDFLRHYRGGILFVHLLPYTQRQQYVASTEGPSDAEMRKEASQAIAGALEEYENVRPDKSRDRHLILVTKWDAHRSEDGDSVDALHDGPAEVRNFVARHYAQAWSAFRALRLAPEQSGLNGYCAGLISGDRVIAVDPADERADALRRFPVGLWRWLYRNTLEAAGEAPVEPFPVARAGLFAGLGRLLDRLF